MKENKNVFGIDMAEEYIYSINPTALFSNRCYIKLVFGFW